jgi:hypothetical protein
LRDIRLLHGPKFLGWLKCQGSVLNFRLHRLMTKPSDGHQIQKKSGIAAHQGEEIDFNGT